MTRLRTGILRLPDRFARLRHAEQQSQHHNSARPQHSISDNPPLVSEAMVFPDIRDYHIEVDRVGREEWSHLLELFEDASIIHVWEYAKVICPGQQVSRLVLKQQEEVVGLAQVRIVKIPFLAIGIANVAWGPLWRRKGASPNPRIFEAMLVALRQEYAENRKLLLRISPNIVAGEEIGFEIVLGRSGFARNPNIPAYRTILLNISRPLEEIRGSFSRKWRQCLKKNEGNTIAIRQGGSPHYFKEFLPIYEDLLIRKKGGYGADIHRWGKLQNILPDQEKPTVFISFHEGTAVAGLVLSSFGDTGLPIFYAANPIGRKYMETQRLIFHAITWLKERGYRQFDMAGIDPEIYPTIYRFKKGCNGREVRFIGTYETGGSRFSRMIIKVGETVRNTIRHAIHFKNILAHDQTRR